MKILLALLLCVGTAQAQYFTDENHLPPLDGNACIVVVHNVTTYAAHASMQGGAAFYRIAAGQTQELLLPNGWNGYIVSWSGSSLGMREYLGSEVDVNKPWVRHVWIMEDYNSPASGLVVGTSAVNFPDPLEDFYLGLGLGWTFVAFIASVRTIKRNLRTNVS